MKNQVFYSPFYIKKTAKNFKIRDLPINAVVEEMSLSTFNFCSNDIKKKKLTKYMTIVDLL